MVRQISLQGEHKDQIAKFGFCAFEIISPHDNCAGVRGSTHNLIMLPTSWLGQCARLVQGQENFTNGAVQARSCPRRPNFSVWHKDKVYEYVNYF